MTSLDDPLAVMLGLLQNLVAFYHMTPKHERVVCEAIDRIAELQARLDAVTALPRHRITKAVDEDGRMELREVEVVYCVDLEKALEKN